MKDEKRDPVEYLQDILNSVGKIERYIEGYDFEKFSKGEKQYMLFLFLEKFSKRYKLI